MSINHATLTSAEIVCYESPKYNSVSNNEHDNLQLQKQQKGVNNTQEGYMYIVDKIIKHPDTPEGRRYLARWFGYTFADDT